LRTVISEPAAVPAASKSLCDGPFVNIFGREVVADGMGGNACSSASGETNGIASSSPAGREDAVALHLQPFARPRKI